MLIATACELWDDRVAERLWGIRVRRLATDDIEIPNDVPTPAIVTVLFRASPRRWLSTHTPPFGYPIHPAGNPEAFTLTHPYWLVEK